MTLNHHDFFVLVLRCWYSIAHTTVINAGAACTITFSGHCGQSVDSFVELASVRSLYVSHCPGELITRSSEVAQTLALSR